MNEWVVAALTSIFTLAVREFIAVLKKGAEHELELKKHYFDKIFDITLEAIREWKLSIAENKRLIDTFLLTLDNDAPLHPSLLTNASNNYKNAIERLQKKQMTSYTRFIYFMSRRFFNQ
jgi:hypothetical protein